MNHCIFKKSSSNPAAPSRAFPGCGAAVVWSLRKTPSYF